jgi:hypothetical protein
MSHYESALLTSPFIPYAGKWEVGLRLMLRVNSVTEPPYLNASRKGTGPHHQGYNKSSLKQCSRMCKLIVFLQT